MDTKCQQIGEQLACQHLPVSSIQPIIAKLSSAECSYLISVEPASQPADRQSITNLYLTQHLRLIGI